MDEAGRCRACASAELMAHYDAPDTMFGSGRSFPYGECAACGTLNLLDVPDDFSPYYPPDYLSMTVDPAALGPATRSLVKATSYAVLRDRTGVGRRVLGAVPVRRMRTLVTILDSVARAPSAPATMLDVGAGSGMVPLAVSLAGGIEVLGIDPFAAGDRRLGDHAELRAIGLDDVKGTFDLVSFHHSLEHVPDPLGALRTAMELLAPGGTVLVRLPTVSSFAWREYGTEWIQLDPPRHVWLPSRAGLAALADAAGLEIVGSYDDSNEFQFWGSEQARRGVALTDQRSQYVNARQSSFSSHELRAFARRARELNDQHDGDQTVVYLRAPSGGAANASTDVR